MSKFNLNDQRTLFGKATQRRINLGLGFEVEEALINRRAESIRVLVCPRQWS